MLPPKATKNAEMFIKFGCQCSPHSPIACLNVSTILSVLSDSSHCSHLLLNRAPSINILLYCLKVLSFVETQ